jgi:hypothetical protein
MPHTYLLSGAGTKGQLVGDVPNGLSLTPPRGECCPMGCDAMKYGRTVPTF